MELRSETETAPATTAVADATSTGRATSATSSTGARTWFAWPAQFTIAQLMILTVVVGLAMTPLAMVRKHDRVESIVAMVAFETIALPALTMIVLLLTMPPGPNRLRTIVILSLVPTLIAAAVVGLVFLATILSNAREIASGDLRHAPVLMVIVGQLIFQLMLRGAHRCPSCRQRQLRLLNSKERSADLLGRGKTIYECKVCGVRSSRSGWQFLRMPQPLDSQEADRATPTARPVAVPVSGSSSG